MERRLERELMDDEAQAFAYAQADFSASNRFFVDTVIEAAPAARAVVDLGCGPADIPIELARRQPGVAITAVDGSASMLELARAAVGEAALDHRITLLHGRLPGLPLPDHAFDLVLSKDLLHHLPDPAVLWGEILRLAAPGASVCVMDLIRTETTTDARRIVETVAPTADPILKEDFYNSLLAAFTLDEVRAQLAAAGLALPVVQVSERHLLVSGHLRPR